MFSLLAVVYVGLRFPFWMNKIPLPYWAERLFFRGCRHRKTRMLRFGSGYRPGVALYEMICSNMQCQKTLLTLTQEDLDRFERQRQRWYTRVLAPVLREVGRECGVLLLLLGTVVAVAGLSTYIWWESLRP